MGILNYLSEEEAMERNNEIEKWKALQPDCIAVKMSNIEIVDALRLNGVFYPDSTKYIIQSTFYKDTYKLIDGQLYQKQLNPKNYDMRHEPVIPWES